MQGSHFSLVHMTGLEWEALWEVIYNRRKLRLL